MRQTEGKGTCNMKTVKDKQILMATDFAGYPLLRARMRRNRNETFGGCL